MIDYFIKSALCLAILLAVYSLFFEKEKMHRFNRFFLLFSLAFGLIIPAVSLDLSSAPVKTIEFSHIREAMAQSPGGAAAAGQTTPDISTETAGILMIVYGIVAGLLIIKFLVNLIRIASKVSRYTKIKTEKGVIILQEEKLVPHSFLNYVFLNKDDYSNKTIEEQIITHEFTHVSQKHSIDILIVELLKIIFWFNPVFTFYKKAIQLNHEFLADESVIISSGNISAYQSMLLQTAGLEPVQLASNFNYSITKKRLIMMEKQFSKLRSVAKSLALVPLMFALTFFFNNAAAQKTSTVSREEFYRGSTLYFLNDSKAGVFKKYDELTVEEQNELPEPTSPTADLIDVWKAFDQYPVIIDHRIPESNGGPQQCRLFIDGENVDSKVLDQYTPSDFVVYSDSKFIKNGFTLISVNLYTPKFIQSLSGDAKLVSIYENQIEIVGKLNPPFFIPEKYR